MIFDYILFCPAFVSNSAGIRAMHYLAAILSKAGLTVGSNGPNPYDDSVRIVTNTEFLGHPIAIYPDCVGPNNPLNLKRIVRFMCAPASWTPIGFFGGHRIPHSDCVFIFDPWLRDDVQEHYDGTLSPDCLLPIPCIEPNLFYAEEKTVEKIVYVGKGPYGGASANAIITRTSHAREHAAALLRKAKRFYTFDHYTMMAHEAALCGCETFKLEPDGTAYSYHTDAAQQYVMRPDKDVAIAYTFNHIANRFFSQAQGVSNRAQSAFQSVLSRSP